MSFGIHWQIYFQLIKINEANKYDLNINKSKEWELSQSIPLRYLLSAYHSLTF